MTLDDHSGVSVRDAATVVLLRDGDAGLETFLLKRGTGTAFVPGAHVFPGGRVDAGDADPAIYEHCDGLDDAAASARLGVAGDGLSFWVAAIREAFEEAGVLLATDRTGIEPDWRDRARRARLAEARAAVHAGELDFVTLLAEEGLRLPVSRLRYYGHWITPPGPPRRYSTRFFAVRSPMGQTLVHDGVEAVDGGWALPNEALRRYRRGELSMILPTVMQLRLLREFDGTDALLESLDAMKRVPVVAPDSPLHG